jgi:CDP-diacylglycerol--glycerol-3-phosphate 3-phosphatidyltransferase
MNETKKKINLPNKITIFRMVVVIVILVLAFLPLNEKLVFEVLGVKHDYRSILMLVLFILGSVSDFLDGYLARKHNLVTTFGKFMDPIADKLLVNTIFILLASGVFIANSVFTYEIHWIVPVIMISRDMVVDAIRLVAVGQGKVIAASKLGKLKTVTQMIAIIAILAFPQVGLLSYLVYLAALASLISGADYFIKNRKIILSDLRG